MMRFGPGYGYGNQMDGGLLLGGFLMLIFWALVIVGIVMLVRWASHTSHPHWMVHDHGLGSPMVPPAPGAAGHDEAVAIAKRRLASGEITSAEYEEIMRVLGS